MKKKVVKKKSSSAPKKPPKKKKVVKRKTAVPKGRTTKKKVVKRKAAAPKGRTAKKKVVKRKAAATKGRTTKKKVAKRKAAALKGRTTKKKVVKQKTSVSQRKTVKKKKTASRLRKISQSGKYMDARQLKYFRKILLSRRNELITEADRTVDYMQADSNTYADTIDQANQEEEFTLQLKERDRERKLLQKIDEALIKIDNHEYGYCVSCGAEIGFERLEARPTTDQCIDCKELDEIKERY